MPGPFNLGGGNGGNGGGGGGSSNPCQTTTGYGDPMPWPDPPAGYTLVQEVDNVTCTLTTQGWQDTGVTVQAGEILAVQAGGEGFFEVSAGAYCYPEGAYGNGGPRTPDSQYNPAACLAAGDFGAFQTLTLLGKGQCLCIKVTPTNAQPAWVGHDSGLLFPNRSALFQSSQIGGGNGGHLWVCTNDNFYSDNSGCYNVSFRRYAQQTSVSTPTTYLPSSYAVQGAIQCISVITVTLTDGTGMPAAVPQGQSQAFTFSDGTSGVFTPQTLTIPAGSSSGQVTYTNPNTGTYTITVIPGAGPLSGQPAQQLTATILCSPSDPLPAICGPTRANLRDAIRRKLGIIPPVDTGGGNPGDEPPGQVYPSNPALNQAIAEAISTINRRCNFHNITQVPLKAPAQSAATLGPQFLSLQGVSANCASKNVINFVRRVVWFDGTTYTRLAPVSFWEKDRSRINFDNAAPSTPTEYFIEGYQLCLLPASANGGTLLLYVGQAVSTLLSDSDWIDELPIDYTQTLVDLAAYLLCTYMPTGPTTEGIPGFADRVPALKALSEQGIDEILRWFNGIAEEWQPSLVVDARRRRRVR